MDDQTLYQYLDTKFTGIQDDIKALKDSQEQLVGMIAKQDVVLESLSRDVSYLVGKEADNGHRIFLLDKSLRKHI